MQDSLSAGWTTLGHIESPYLQKNGTPRQPGIAPAASARLRLTWGTSPQDALADIEHFSHLWLLWIFDKNDNKALKNKAKPPRLGGAATGVFACRTPHRPNPIGLSLVALKARDGDTLLLEGVDLVDGTPIIDIKPYIPFADAWPDPSTVRTAYWVPNPSTLSEANRVGDSPNEATHFGQHVGDLQVVFSSTAVDELRKICCDSSKSLSRSATCRVHARTLRFFRNDPERAQAAFSQALASDTRSIYRKEKCKGELYRMNLDGIDAICEFVGQTVNVLNVELIGDPCVVVATSPNEN